MITAMTFHVNAPKEEAVSIAVKFHERYVSWILSIIFYYIYRVKSGRGENGRVSYTFSINLHNWNARTHTKIHEEIVE